MIGTVLKDRYCVIERIGQGGGGRLYLARDMELGLFRAVKEIPISGKKEAKVMRSLEHPGIPRIVDYIENEEFCYLIMEYIRGSSLGEFLREGRRFSLQEILALGEETAGILEYLHSRKPPVCYGDLKPDNLMLSRTGHLYLVDLGSAIFAYGKKKQVCEGTIGYAAPEQYQGHISGKSDIYALGKTMETLLGKRKFLYLLYPEFFFFLFRCTRKKEKNRYENMHTVTKVIRKMEIRYRTITWRKRFLEITGAVFLVGMLAFGVSWLAPESFPEALSEITDLYYQAEQYPVTSTDRKKLCKTAEKKLQKISRSYREKEQQRRISVLLAWNAELMEEPERSALYYENLLLYDEDFLDGYGEYGMFLLRNGQEKASEKLWKAYKKIEEADCEKTEKGRNLILWEEINEKKTGK